MTFNHFNRRLHLYLALTLLPWFLMYGISSIPFSHGKLLDEWYNDGVPLWTTRFDRPFDMAVPPGDLRPLGERIVKDSGLEGSFGTYRDGKTIKVYLHTFRKSTQFTYFPQEKRLLAQDRRFRWDGFFTGMHARGGFEHAGPLETSWSLLVDVVCAGFVLWIASGVYMWWQLSGHRFWGWIALGSGAALFVIFLVAL